MTVPRSSGVRAVGIVVVSVAVAAGLFVGAFAALLPMPVIPPPPVLAIESVTLSPDPPVSDRPVALVARLSRAAAAVDAGYVSSFGSSVASGTSMIPSPGGGNLYEATIGPFSAGTEVWFVVTASSADLVVRSNASAFQVGSVLRGGPFNLRVSLPVRTPTEPTGGTMVRVEADITTGTAVREADLESVGIGSGYAFGESFVMDENGTHFAAAFIATGGTTFVYRVVAQDVTGNTAVSDAFSFDVPGYGGPVP